ncbi:addiction module antitoxin [Bradyrhizobium sp. Gha]|uniref:addiction module antitoxin n=1 Tax=Bradyrhizobium sp. Gha TaxID=1855318 RepID=UPI000B81111D
MLFGRSPIVPSKLADELNIALASAEPNRICKAIGIALGDFNIAEIARQTGLQRQSIYRAFQTHTQLPNSTTILAVLTAMGLQLKVIPKRERPRAGTVNAML